MKLPHSIRTHPLHGKVKLAVKRMLGRELWVRPEVEIETQSEGGWDFCPSRLQPGSVVYSLGIGDSIVFDLKVIELFGSTIHAFDPTPYSLETIAVQEPPEEFVFHQWAVSGSDGILKMVRRVHRKGVESEAMWTVATGSSDAADVIEVPCYSLPSIMEKLGHERIDLLKMDIEGSEYEVIDTLVNMPHKPSQLFVEFHHRFPGIGPDKTRQALKQLRAAGYRIFSVSPTGREISFIQESLL